MNDRSLIRSLRAAVMSLLLLPACGGGDEFSDRSNSLQSAEHDDVELHTRALSGTPLVLSRVSVEHVASANPSADELRVQAQLTRPSGDTTIRLEFGASYLNASSEDHELMLRLEGDNLEGHWAQLDSGERYGEFAYPREQLSAVSDDHPGSGLLDVLRERFEPGRGNAAELDELLPIIDAVASHLAEEAGMSTDVTRYFLAKLVVESQTGASPVDAGPDQWAADPGGALACENGCECDQNGTLCGACCDADQTPTCGTDSYGWCSCTCESGGGDNCGGFGCEEHNY